MAFVKKNLPIIALVIVILGAGYYFIFLQGGSNDDTISVTNGPASDAEARFINLSSQLEPIHFDTSIFSDPRFNALTDIHTSIVPETKGRPDPFGPIPGLAAAK